MEKKEKKYLVKLKAADHAKMKMLAARDSHTLNFMIEQAIREFILKHDLKNE